MSENLPPRQPDMLTLLGAFKAATDASRGIVQQLRNRSQLTGGAPERQLALVMTKLDEADLWMRSAVEHAQVRELESFRREPTKP